MTKMEDLLESFRQWWFVFAVIGVGVAAWTTNTMNVANAQDRIDTAVNVYKQLEEDVEKNEDEISEIKNGITRIETNQKNFKEDIDDMKDLLKDIAKNTGS
jgi:peptidoglycan hydrolase CwlO-like protein